MSEEIKKINAFNAFQKVQQTFAEAEEKAKQEAGTPRVERFRIGEDGEYTLRILPLAPDFDESGNILPMTRKGYEYPIHQFFLPITMPSKKGGKVKKINIPVIRTTDKEVGHSVDLIDTYVKIAKEMYADDEDLMKLLTSNAFSGGLRYNYQHAIMVLDVSSDKERAKGPQLWQCSHNQYKLIDNAKMRLWRELHEDGGQETCPISGFIDAYPVKIIRENNNGKTEYTVEIGRKTLDIKEEEAQKLLDMPRIPEQIYRYTKYQLEATLVFLQQYDEKHDMEVCKESDFLEAVEKLKGELPADDNSHFDLADAGGKASEKAEKVTLDSLWSEYDAIVAQEYSEKSDEYQDFREKIRQFVEDNGIDVRLSRSKNNQQLLEEIEAALDESAHATKKEAEPKKEEESEEPARRAPRPKASEPEEQDDEENEDEEDEDEDKEEQPEEKPAETPRHRRPRPGSESVEEESKPKEPEAPKEEAPASDEEAPRRRVRARRLR